jgi:hypothetical protein
MQETNRPKIGGNSMRETRKERNAGNDDNYTVVIVYDVANKGYENI